MFPTSPVTHPAPDPRDPRHPRTLGGSPPLARTLARLPMTRPFRRRPQPARVASEMVATLTSGASFRGPRPSSSFPLPPSQRSGHGANRLGALGHRLERQRLAGVTVEEV